MGTKNVIQLLSNANADSQPLQLSDGGSYFFQASFTGGTGTGNLQIRGPDDIGWTTIANSSFGNIGVVVELPAGAVIRVTVGSQTGVHARLSFIRN
jgi:hypothetical protein